VKENKDLGKLVQNYLSKYHNDRVWTIVTMTDYGYKVIEQSSNNLFKEMGPEFSYQVKKPAYDSIDIHDTYY
jgi:hypothetical protein